MRRRWWRVLPYLALAGFGCTPTPASDLVGTWKGTIDKAEWMVTFRPDGTESQHIAAPGQTITIDATYKAENGTLTHTLTRGTNDGTPVEAKGKTDTLTYRLDGDTLTLTKDASSSPIVLKRVP